jgi:hypothetical protein
MDSSELNSRWPRCPSGILIVAVLLLTPAKIANALDAFPIDHVSIGYLAHDVGGLWSGARFERAATAINLDIVFSPSFDLLGGEIRPALGGTIARGDGTSYGYADMRYEIKAAWGGFAGVGLGLAIHDGTIDRSGLACDCIADADRHFPKALGSRELFHVPIEVGFEINRLRFSAYFEHVSNGWLGTSINEGMDNIGLRIGFAF